MAIDDFGKYESDPQDQKKWTELRKTAFMAAACGKFGLHKTLETLVVTGGNINAAVDKLGIDEEFKVQVDKAMAATTSEISVEPN